MELSEEFSIFCNKLDLQKDEIEKWNKRLNSVTRKLNKKYYGIDDESSNMMVVGSVGRGTAINQVSDWDCIFTMPGDVYYRFNAYKNGGQSALLQEIKCELQELYPNTDIKGDGQIVGISFNGGDIELVPGFKTSDGSYRYPDSGDGGSWRITNPIPEQNEAKDMASKTNNHYLHLCKLLRCWKNNVGFKFKGLLIDTLVKNFIDENYSEKEISFSDYKEILSELFLYLSMQDKNCSYWSALGSNQHIINDDKAAFTSRAKKAYDKLLNGNNISDLYDTCIELFGNSFSEEQILRAPDEEFVYSKFNIDVKYDLKLDCIISENGFPPKRLRDFLKNKQRLRTSKQLKFEVLNHNIPKGLLKHVSWYWKIRNVGEEAVKREMERGQIILGKKIREERTDFNGDHYVECYAVKGNTVIARGYIDVPIDSYLGVD